MGDMYIGEDLMKDGKDMNDLRKLCKQYRAFSIRAEEERLRLREVEYRLVGVHGQSYQQRLHNGINHEAKMISLLEEKDNISRRLGVYESVMRMVEDLLLSIDGNGDQLLVWTALVEHENRQTLSDRYGISTRMIETKITRQLHKTAKRYPKEVAELAQLADMADSFTSNRQIPWYDGKAEICER